MASRRKAGVEIGCLTVLVIVAVVLILTGHGAWVLGTACTLVALIIACVVACCFLMAVTPDPKNGKTGDDDADN